MVRFSHRVSFGFITDVNCGCARDALAIQAYANKNIFRVASTTLARASIMKPRSSLSMPSRSIKTTPTLTTNWRRATSRPRNGRTPTRS